MPRIPRDAMLTKLRKKDFLRTDRPALKMIGGKKNLQHAQDKLVPAVVAVATAGRQQCHGEDKAKAYSRCGSPSIAGGAWGHMLSSYVKKFPGLNVSMS